MLENFGGHTYAPPDYQMKVGMWVLLPKRFDRLRFNSKYPCPGTNQCRHRDYDAEIRLQGYFFPSSSTDLKEFNNLSGPDNTKTHFLHSITSYDYGTKVKS